MMKNKSLILAIGVFIVIFNKLVLSRWGIPNVEMIIPALIVFGCFINSNKLPLLALSSLMVLDMLIWGFNLIYLFTWSGFILCWYIWGRKAFDPFGRTRKILKGSMFSVLGAILFFDIYTALGCWLLWYPKTIAGLAATYFAQVPFTLYHLLSLGFVPPFVLVGKTLIRVPVKISVTTCIRSEGKVMAK